MVRGKSFLSGYGYLWCVELNCSDWKMIHTPRRWSAPYFHISCPFGVLTKGNSESNECVCERASQIRLGPRFRPHPRSALWRVYGLPGDQSPAPLPGKQPALVALVLFLYGNRYHEIYPRGFFWAHPVPPL